MPFVNSFNVTGALFGKRIAFFLLSNERLLSEAAFPELGRHGPRFHSYFSTEVRVRQIFSTEDVQIGRLLKC